MRTAQSLGIVACVPLILTTAALAGPSEALIDAMDDARGGSDEDYHDVRNDAVKEVVGLAHGNDADTDQIGEQAAAFLDRVRKMSDADYKAKRAELEAEAKRIGE